MPVDLVLASASPRRRELLERIGLRLRLRPVDVDERPHDGELPGDYVRRLAESKCSRAAEAADISEAGALLAGPPVPIVAADTTVALAGEIFGKPRDEAEAARMLQQLAGRRHEVITCYAIRLGTRALGRTVTTQVTMRLVAPEEIAAYVASREWTDKAGGYAVQGKAALFVTELRGSFTNVIGLPLAEVVADLRALGALPDYPRGVRAARRKQRTGRMTRAQQIESDLARVAERISRAARAAGRDSGSVRLLAVSKKMPVEDIRAALAAGQIDFGENYAQELRDKRAAFEAMSMPGMPAARWHFIGPLQRNKVKYVAGHATLVHALDSAELLDEMNQRVPQGTVQDCLLQVNVAGETQKHGATASDVPLLLDRFAHLPRLRCVGLMQIPPFDQNPEATRPYFAALRRLRDTQAAISRPGVDLRELSMGMSHDLEAAISEGATIVRIGTAIFGPRPP